MKSTTPVTAVTTLTKARVVAAPFVMFVVLYVVQVQPQRAASLDARGQLEAARDELNRERLLARTPVAATAAAALDEFETRTAEGDRVREVVDAITALLKSPPMGGVSNLLVAIGEAADGPVDSVVGPFSRKVWHAPITVTFDARYEQIGRFFFNLRSLPTTFDLRGVDLAPHGAFRAGLVSAKVSLLVFHRSVATSQSGAPPSKTAGSVASAERMRDPFAQQRRPAVVADRPVASKTHPDPVVTGILVAGRRRVALVDGRIVQAGDPVQDAVVQAIEPDVVIIAGPGSQTRRLKLERRAIRMGLAEM